MPDHDIAALRTYAQAQGWQYSRGKPIQHGEQAIIDDGTHRVVVNYYPKRGRIVLGGPESPLKAALRAWIDDTIPPEPRAQPAGGTRLDELKAFIQAQGWNWGPGASISHGEQIVVSDGQGTVLVNFWPKRGKMQVQGGTSPLRADLEEWIGTTVSTTEQPAATFTGPHIGMDESGKGDWFGPLVVAAVYVDERTASVLRRSGVQDSKTLAAVSIQRLAGQIERIVSPEYCALRIIEPEKYNELYATHGNINLLLAEAYAEAAGKLWAAVAQTSNPPIVCDQFSQRTDRLADAFAARGLPQPVQQHHAEQASIAVAAASILASAAFADALERLGQTAGYDGPLPRGASDVMALEAAARFIAARQGAAALRRYAKLNFKPLEKFLRA